MVNAGPRRVVLAGGSGQVGALLARHFHAQGSAVVALGRTKRTAPWRTFEWDGATRGAWSGELEGIDVLVNLSGRSVNSR
jgi:NAD dependent epimerase/dehydratase family enzyme